MAEKEKSLYILHVIVMTALIAAGLIEQGPLTALKELLRLQLHPARLLHQYRFTYGVAHTIDSAIES